MLETLLRWLDRVVPFTSASTATDEAQAAPQRIDGEKLIHRIDLTVDASCPCGSQIIHHLTLMTTVDCPRCGRTLAIRSITYFRTSPAAVPKPVITMGWVHSSEALRKSETRGVH